MEQVVSFHSYEPTVQMIPEITTTAIYTGLELLAEINTLLNGYLSSFVPKNCPFEK